MAAFFLLRLRLGGEEPELLPFLLLPSRSRLLPSHMLSHAHTLVWHRVILTGKRPGVTGKRPGAAHAQRRGFGGVRCVGDRALARDHERDGSLRYVTLHHSTLQSAVGYLGLAHDDERDGLARANLHVM